MLVTYILYKKIIETKQDEYSQLVWAVKIEVSEPHHTITHGLQQYPPANLLMNITIQNSSSRSGCILPSYTLPQTGWLPGLVKSELPAQSGSFSSSYYTISMPSLLPLFNFLASDDDRCR